MLANCVMKDKIARGRRWIPARPTPGGSSSASQSHWTSSVGGCSVSIVAQPDAKGARLAERAQ